MKYFTHIFSLRNTVNNGKMYNEFGLSFHMSVHCNSGKHTWINYVSKGGFEGDYEVFIISFVIHNLFTGVLI